MKKSLEIPMIFDDVQFGIDVREKRRAFNMTQNLLAALVGYKDGNSISTVETATHTDSMTVRRYMSICNVLHLNPMHYWDTVPDVYANAYGGWDVSVDDV